MNSFPHSFLLLFTPIKNVKKLLLFHHLAAVNSLLESINEKDEHVRNAVENALVRMIESRPNQTIAALCEFKVKQPKLSDQATVIILRLDFLFRTAIITHNV